MSSDHAERPAPAFVPAYTVALLVVAGLAGALAWIESGLIDELAAGGDTGWAIVFRFDQIIALVLSPLSLLTGIARIRCWLFAGRLTRVVSIVLVLAVPIGTALFVYWLFWVRKRERRADCQ